MIEQELAEIRARADAAAKGPWTYKHWLANEYSVNSPQHCHIRPDQEDDGWRIFLITEEADAAFISAARTDVPMLLDEIDRLQGVVDRIGDVVDSTGELDEMLDILARVTKRKGGEL